MPLPDAHLAANLGPGPGPGRPREPGIPLQLPVDDRPTVPLEPPPEAPARPVIVISPDDDPDEDDDGAPKRRPGVIEIDIA